MKFLGLFLSRGPIRIAVPKSDRNRDVAVRGHRDRDSGYENFKNLLIQFFYNHNL